MESWVNCVLRSTFLIFWQKQKQVLKKHYATLKQMLKQTRSNLLNKKNKKHKTCGAERKRWGR